MNALLIERGVPAEKMILEDSAASTIENFINTARQAGFTRVMRLPAPSDPVRFGVNVAWEVILAISAIRPAAPAP